MGKPVAIEKLSLDGVMEAPGRPDEACAAVSPMAGGRRQNGWASGGNRPVPRAIANKFAATRAQLSPCEF